MKTSIIPVAIALAIVLAPVASFAATKTAKSAAPVYQCSICHMKFTAAQAKKDHYKDPMDGGKLVPVHAATSKSAATKSNSMGGMKM